MKINKKHIKDVNDISKRRQKLIYNAYSGPPNPHSPSLSHSLSQVCDSLLIDVCLLPCAVRKMRRNFSLTTLVFVYFLFFKLHKLSVLLEMFIHSALK